MSVQFAVTSYYCSLPFVFNTKNSLLAVKIVLISTEISRDVQMKNQGKFFFKFLKKWSCNIVQLWLCLLYLITFQFVSLVVTQLVIL